MIKSFIKYNKPLIIDIIFSIAFIGGYILMYLNYESWLDLEYLPSGKAAKAGKILMNLLDKIGGKYFTISVIILLTSPFIYRTVRKLMRQGFKLPGKDEVVAISANDTFRYKDYKIHVSEAVRSQEGYTGKGWVELSLINKTKKELVFTNVELDENRKAIKGDIKFLEQ